MKWQHLFMAMGVVTIWGVNFSVVKIGLQDYPPILFSGVRFLLVAIPAVFFIPFPKTSIWYVVVVGVCLGIFKFSLLFLAMKTDISAGLASLVLQVQVFFTIGFSIAVFKESISISQVIGICCAVLGFIVLFGNSGENVTLVGLLMVASAAIFWAISNVVMKKMQGVNLLHFFVWISLIPPIPLFILSYIYETSDPISVIKSATTTSWFSALYVSYMSTLLAFAMWGYLLRSYSSATVAPFALLIPVIGMGTSWLLLDETISRYEAVGAVGILAGLVWCVLGHKVLVKINREQR
ncbi:MAG: EamA family transporter [Agarilytica sp.]